MGKSDFKPIESRDGEEFWDPELIVYLGKEDEITGGHRGDQLSSREFDRHFTSDTTVERPTSPPSLPDPDERILGLEQEVLLYVLQDLYCGRRAFAATTREWTATQGKQGKVCTRSVQDQRETKT